MFSEEERTKLWKKIDDNLGKVEIMKRCLPWQNQNVNESAHQRLFNICSKSKFVEPGRLLFAARHVATTMNVGMTRGSLLASYFGMTKDEYMTYRTQDGRTLQRAKKPGSKKRMKLVADPNQPLNYSYGQGF